MWSYATGERYIFTKYMDGYKMQNTNQYNLFGICIDFVHENLKQTMLLALLTVNCGYKSMDS